MKNNRVFITGYATLTPFGTDTKKTWINLLKGKSAISELSQKGNRIKIGGEIKEDLLKALHISFSGQDRSTAFTKVVIKSLLKKCPLNKNDQVGLVVGTGFGTIQNTKTNYYRCLVDKKRPLPKTIPSTMQNAISSEPAISFGLTGTNYCIFTACSSGTNATGHAHHWIKSGYESQMIAVGVDTALTPLILDAWSALRVTSDSNEPPHCVSQPFSLNRTGFVFSEGAAAIMLESEDCIRKSGHTPLAEICAYTSNCDATHITSPNIEAQAIAVKKCLNDAEISYQDIDLISAHGTSTKVNDEAEAKLIHAIFKEKAKKIPVNALKSQFGHCIGASAVLETIFSIEMMNNGWLIPTINHTPDPSCDLDLIPNQKRQHSGIRYLLKNSFGFGGNNAVLILKETK